MFSISCVTTERGGSRISPPHHLLQSAALLGGDVLAPSAKANVGRDAQPVMMACWERRMYKGSCREGKCAMLAKEPPETGAHMYTQCH